MTAQHLLNDLGLTMGLTQLRLDDHGCARLMFDGKTAINLELDQASQVLHLYTVVGSLPAEGRETLYLSLLQANLFSAQTLGSTLAVDTAHNDIVLCRTVTPDQVTGAQFTAIVEKFVAAAEEWSSNLASGASRSTSQGLASEPSPYAPVEQFGQFLRA